MAYLEPVDQTMLDIPEQILFCLGFMASSISLLCKINDDANYLIWIDTPRRENSKGNATASGPPLCKPKRIPTDVVQLQHTDIYDNGLAAVRHFCQKHVYTVQKATRFFRTILAFTVQIVEPNPAKTEAASDT